MNGDVKTVRKQGWYWVARSGFWHVMFWNECNWYYGSDLQNEETFNKVLPFPVEEPND